ncbi:MAG: FGGY family carbohydrate kinase [Bacteroidota bacterium]
MDIIVVFDIGKVKRKVLFFNNSLEVVYKDEIKIKEKLNENGILIDDVEGVVDWVYNVIDSTISKNVYTIKGVNFSTYGASLIYLNDEGKKLGYLYNNMMSLPYSFGRELYDKHGGVFEFARKTSSSLLGFQNSGLQLKWLKEERPDTYKQAKHVLHFPQYLSYLFTGKIVSEFTTIGCHTAMWDFEENKYHNWLNDIDINIPEPVETKQNHTVNYKGHEFKVGVGIMDAMADLLPYLSTDTDEFLMLYTKRWCVAMNPFNREPLTPKEVENECSCYLSYNNDQVKSSRFYLAHIHDVHVEKIAEQFNVSVDEIEKVNLNEDVLEELADNVSEERMFFVDGIPENYIDTYVDISLFKNYKEAYHQLMIDLTRINIESIELVIPESDHSNKIYVTGRFSYNDIYMKLLSGYFMDKRVFTSEIDSPEALGAALMLYDEIFPGNEVKIDLGLKEWKSEVNLEEY